MTRRRRILIIVLIVAVLLAAALVAAMLAIGVIGVKFHIVDDGNSDQPIISANGRYVAFVSEDKRLVAGDDSECHLNNGREYNCSDVFVKDLQTRDISMASVSPSGENGNGDSPRVAGISADGKYVLFDTGADNLMPGNSGFVLKNMLSGEIEIIGESYFKAKKAIGSAALSANGRLVAFWSDGIFDEADKNNSPDLFVKNIDTGAITRVSDSMEKNHGHPDPGQLQPAFSADNKHICYSERLIFPEREPSLRYGSQVVVANLDTSETRLASSMENGDALNSSSSSCSISGDGRYVAFESTATNIPPVLKEGGGYVPRVFLKDMATGKISMLDNSPGQTTRDDSSSPVISADGRFIAFVDNYLNSIYRFNAQTGEMKLVSSTDGVTGMEGDFPTISADGRFIAFVHTESYKESPEERCWEGSGTSEPHISLFPGLRENSPQEHCRDVFVKDMDTGELSLVSNPIGE